MIRFILISSCFFIFLLSCARSNWNLGANERLYSYESSNIKIEFLVNGDNFKLWIREAVTSCYNEGTYSIKHNKIILNSFVTTNDKGYEAVYEAGECNLDSTVIQIMNQDSIHFDEYILLHDGSVLK